MAGDSHYNFYHYNPNIEAAAIFVVLFALTTIVHAYQLFRHTCWYYIPMLIGGLFEVTGYIGRALSHDNVYEIGPYIIQSVLILVAPALMAASIYMTFGRLVLKVGESNMSIIPVKYLTLTFVGGDVCSFMTQSTGAGLLAKSKPSSQLAGNWIIRGGLIIQILWFALFIVTAIIWHTRMNARSKETTTLNWRKYLWVLYIGSVLVLVRSIYRLVEYIVGYNGYIIRHEVFLYVFDATLMFITMFAFNIIYPSGFNKHKKEHNVQDVEMTA